jgi:hypothetical protein
MRISIRLSIRQMTRLRQSPTETNHRDFQQAPPELAGTPVRS